MIIDLSEWNEYITDDARSGPVPHGIPLETMQIVTADAFKETPKDCFPTGLKAEPASVKCRIFWRIKR